MHMRIPKYSKRMAVISGTAVMLITALIIAFVLVFSKQQNISSSSMPDIIMMSIDTLRADHLGCYGYDKNTSPNIDAFASEALLFTNAFSPSPITTPAHMSIFTGLMPSVHRVVKLAPDRINRLDPRVETFINKLRNRGYMTVGLHAGGMMSSEFGFGRGFDLYSEKLLSYNWHRALEFPDDMNLIRKVLKTARNESRPLFLFLHHYVCHDPYTSAPESIRSRFLVNPVPGLSKGLPDKKRIQFLREFIKEPESETDRLSSQQAHQMTFASKFWEGVDLSRPEHRRHIISLYDSGIYFSDLLFGRLMDLLREMERYDDSVIILLSDHGEEFFEHGSRTHWQLFVETLHVPLIIKLPSGYAGTSNGRITRDVRTVDLFPTIFDLIDLPIDTNIQGKSFSSLINESGVPYSPTVVSYDSNLRSVRLIKNNFIYTDFMNHGTGEWLFSRPDDPAEQRNLAPSRPDILEKMRLIARNIRYRDSKFLRGMGTLPAMSVKKPSQALIQQLRALGYLDNGDAHHP